MWNNNDEDYDHVDAGNQERDELGKEVFDIDTGSNFRLNSHFFLFVSSFELFQLLMLGFNIYRITPKVPKPFNFGTLMHLHL